MRSAAVLLVLFVLAANVYAEDMVAVNSIDGKDVLSGIFYANVKGEPVKFMPSQAADASVFAVKVGSGHSVLLIQSDRPVSAAVEGALKAKNTVELYPSLNAGTTNLNLAKRSGAERFIIVDSAYTDNALSALPYAALTKSYILFADKYNVDQVKAVVSGKNVTIFGLVDANVSAALAPLKPQVIGKGEDKFEDNAIISGIIMQQFNISNAIMADGSFIEETMATDRKPIILAGRLIPQPTYDFVKSQVNGGKLAQVKLIGTDLALPVEDMRTKMEAEFKKAGSNKSFSVIIYYAQVVPSSGSNVMVLDTFKLPAYAPELHVTAISYNKQTRKVLVTLGNTGTGALFYTPQMTINVNGRSNATFTNGAGRILERGEKVNLEYSYDTSAVSQGNVTAVVNVKYGPSKISLDSQTTGEKLLATVEYVDSSNVSVQYAKYDSAARLMRVTLRNNGAATAYASAKLGFLADSGPVNISGGGMRQMAPGELAVEEFPLELSDDELARNANINVFISYGGRSQFLVKQAQYVVPLEKEAGSVLSLLLGIIVLFIIIVAVYLYMRKLPGARAGSEKLAGAHEAKKHDAARKYESAKKHEAAKKRK